MTGGAPGHFFGKLKNWLQIWLGLTRETINTVVTPLGPAGNFIVRQTGGTPGTNEVQFNHTGTNVNIYNATSGGALYLQVYTGYRLGATLIGNCVALNSPDNLPIAFCILSVNYVTVTTAGLTVGSALKIGFTSASAPDNGAADTYFTRLAVAVFGTNSWLQNTGGSSRVAGNVTNNAATMANMTGISHTLIAGRKYAGRLVVYCSDDQAAEGIMFDFDGGGATMTSFAAAVTGNIQGATLGVTVSAALATDLTATAMNGTGTHCITIDFSLVCNAAGTFIPRFAQNSHTSGTATVLLGSYCLMEDMP